jgi:hypothetical protein
VAIVDTDCHHGDGTQDIYWHDPDTLFISMHQDGRTLYPGTGFSNELGGPNALGTTINIPLPPHTSEEGFLYVTQNVVKPILEDFKPQLVINSAGQDNHFSDPITNMNFSAQGYAQLTSILQPDIAVLEGGYAIEGALPYVNVGIILAMAGLDYSQVREPNYDPVKIRQTRETSRRIEQIGELTLQNWAQREQRSARSRERRGLDRRTRNIFYDTDNLLESQKEIISICPDCAGALQIDSTADRGRHVLCVHIPRKACQACREIGYQWFETAQREAYDAVILQDRTADTYQQRQHGA